MVGSSPRAHFCSRAALSAAGPEWLSDIAIIDRFDYTDDGRDLRAITFELTFANDSGDRSSDEVNQHLHDLVGAIHAGFSERGVAQRT